VPFRVTPKSVLGAFIGTGRTGDADFDARFDIDSGGAPNEALRGHAALRRLVARAFEEFGVEELRATDRSVVAVVPCGELETEMGRQLVALLGEIAPHIERAPIEVKVLGGERKALVGAGHGAARCSYCHAVVTGAEPDLIACAACATVLHEGCWGELGRCPVMGCGGAAPERARTS